MRMRFYNVSPGFTLLELTIVLVVIALIIGGVLIGRDLFRSAELRMQIGQINQFITAVNAFRNKYNGLPGDLEAVQAIAFGFETRSGTDSGNGNGMLETCSSLTGGTFKHLSCETSLFWNDLAAAGLISFQFPYNTDNPIEIPAGQQARFLPAGEIGNNTFFAVFTTSAVLLGLNKYPFVFSIAGINSTAADGAYQQTNRLTPKDVFAIDNKIDDGRPGRGRVVGGSVDSLGIGVQNIWSATGNACVKDAPPSIESSNYSIAPPYGDQLFCGLNIGYK